MQQPNQDLTYHGQNIPAECKMNLNKDDDVVHD
jgi:hypothetical protein